MKLLPQTESKTGKSLVIMEPIEKPLKMIGFMLSQAIFEKIGYVSDDLDTTKSLDKIDFKKITQSKEQCRNMMQIELKSKPNESSTNSLVQPETKRPYSCSICSKTFIRPDHLSTHKLIHLPKDQRPFGCKICLHRTCRRDEMKKHFDNRHKQIVVDQDKSFFSAVDGNFWKYYVDEKTIDVSSIDNLALKNKEYKEKKEVSSQILPSLGKSTRKRYLLPVKVEEGFKDMKMSEDQEDHMSSVTIVNSRDQQNNRRPNRQSTTSGPLFDRFLDNSVEYYGQ